VGGAVVAMMAGMGSVMTSARLDAAEKQKLVTQIWRRVPVWVRKRFWRGTNYGVHEPSHGLTATLVTEASTEVIKACNAVMAADAEVFDPHEIAAKLPALMKIKRDLEYRLPENGNPLANIVLGREQCVELLTYIAALERAPQGAR
jgi:hypothetical protein